MAWNSRANALLAGRGGTPGDALGGIRLRARELGHRADADLLVGDSIRFNCAWRCGGAAVVCYTANSAAPLAPVVYLYVTALKEGVEFGGRIPFFF